MTQASDAPRRHRVPRAVNTFPPSSLRPRSLQAPLLALVESAPPQRDRGGSLGGVGTAMVVSAAAAIAAAGGSLKQQHEARTVYARSLPPQSAASMRLLPPPDVQLGSNTEVAEPRTTRRTSKVARRSRRSSQVRHQRGPATVPDQNVAHRSVLVRLLLDNKSAQNHGGAHVSFLLQIWPERRRSVTARNGVPASWPDGPAASSARAHVAQVATLAATASSRAAGRHHTGDERRPDGWRDGRSAARRQLPGRCDRHRPSEH